MVARSLAPQGPHLNGAARAGIDGGRKMRPTPAVMPRPIAFRFPRAVAGPIAGHVNSSNVSAGLSVVLIYLFGDAQRLLHRLRQRGPDDHRGGRGLPDAAGGGLVAARADVHGKRRHRLHRRTDCRCGDRRWFHSPGSLVDGRGRPGRSTPQTSHMSSRSWRRRSWSPSPATPSSRAAVQGGGSTTEASPERANVLVAGGRLELPTSRL